MKIGHLFWQPTPDMDYSHHERLRVPGGLLGGQLEHRGLVVGLTWP